MLNSAGSLEYAPPLSRSRAISSSGPRPRERKRASAASSGIGAARSSRVEPRQFGLQKNNAEGAPVASSSVSPGDFHHRSFDNHRPGSGGEQGYGRSPEVRDGQLGGRHHSAQRLRQGRRHRARCRAAREHRGDCGGPAVSSSRWACCTTSGSRTPMACTASSGPTTSPTRPATRSRSGVFKTPALLTSPTNPSSKHYVFCLNIRWIKFSIITKTPSTPNPAINDRAEGVNAFREEAPCDPAPEGMMDSPVQAPITAS